MAGFRSHFQGNLGGTYKEMYVRQSDNFFWDFVAVAFASNPTSSAARKDFQIVSASLAPGLFFINHTQDLGSPDRVTRLVWDASLSEVVLADEWRIIDGIRLPLGWNPDYDEMEPGIR